MNAQMRMPQSGSRVRSQSRRRFIVASERSSKPGEVVVVRRSDSASVAIDAGFKFWTGSSAVAVFDSTSGEVVQAWSEAAR